MRALESRELLSSGKALFALLVLWFSTAVHAANYVYDADGRLRAVISSSGGAGYYNYDKLGNLLSVTSVPAGQLSIFAFTPNHGPVGTSVTITGQGFSTTAANNTVKFNGVGATVASATATQLVVTVPAAASSGTISVTVGSSSATSADVFTVSTDSGGQPPTITSFTPTLANPGTAISVSGNRFISNAGATSAGVGEVLNVVTPTSTTQLAFNVPTQTGSGPVTVMTPYGMAQSSQTLIVLPSSVPVANVVSSASLTVGGAAQSINIGTAGKSAVATFSGSTAQWLSLQFSNFSSNPTQAVNVSLYGPTGTDLGDDQISTNVQSVHLPALPGIGTYTVVFTPASGGTAQFGVQLESNPLVPQTGTVSIATAVAGQSKRVLYTGNYQQYLGLYVNSSSTTPAGTNIYEDIWGPIGEKFTSTPIQRMQTFTNLLALTETGTGYALFVGDQGATFSAQLSMNANPTGALTLNAAPLAKTIADPMENAYLTFAATAGQNISIAVSNISTNPSGNYLYYALYNPDGTYSTYNMTYGSSMHQALNNLPQTGTYLIAAYGGASPTFSTNVSTDVTGSLTSNTAKAVTLSKPGQVGRYTFTGAVGQYFGLNLASVATVPAGGNVTMTVLQPDGTAMSYGSAHTTSSYFLNLLKLTQAGTYTVQVEPDAADTATAQLTLVPISVVSATVDGAPANVSGSYAGENGLLTFSANAGQNISFAMTSVATTPTGSYVYVNLYAPDGSYYTSINCSSPCHQGLTNLPQTGPYLAVLEPAGGSQNYSMAATVQISTDTSAALTLDTPYTLNLTKPGQVARLTFTGSAGQYLSLNVAGVSTTPSGGHLNFYVYKPDGSGLAGSGAQATSSYFQNLPRLPVAGTYTVQFEADGADTATAQLTLTANPIASASIDGAPVSVSGSYPGEYGFVTFNATAGQSLSFALTSVATTPSGSYIYVNIYDPNLSYVTSLNCSSPCHGSLPNLGVSGTYVAYLEPAGGSQTVSMSGTAQVSSDATGSLTLGTPYSVNLTKPGQVARLTFAGTVGQYVALNLTGVATNPSGGNITLRVYQSNGTQITSASTGTNVFLNLPALPQTGTYTVQLEADAADTSSAQLTLLANPLASLTINGSGSNLSTPYGGEYAYATFVGSSGQSVTFNLSNVSLTPSGYLVYNVYTPTGSLWLQHLCQATSCTDPFGALPAGGTYTILVSPSPGTSTETFTAGMTSP